MAQVISPRVSIHMRSKSDNVLHTQHHSTESFDTSDSTIMWDAKAQGVNKKLMRLAVDSRSRSSTKRQSLLFDESGAIPAKTEIIHMSKSSDDIPCRKIKHKRPDAYGEEEENARFPRMEEMSHFHYSTVTFDTDIKVSLCQIEEAMTSSLETGHSALTVEVSSKNKSWIVQRSREDFVGLDRQIHRCLYDRRYSQLPELKDCEEAGSTIDKDMVKQMQFYLERFSELSGNNLNCGPILNWLELDNHGNHLVVMEADDSAINVPAVAAGRAIKRYQAQAPDEMSLEVGDFLSVIDMPSTEETIWWRGKKGFEVGFFPSHCIEVLGEKEINEQILNQLQARPVSKRRGKFISFLRFFFKSRPSKDELMQHGILRERVFGCDLGERLAHTGRNIPIVLEMCAAVIEEHGIVDGIYRLSGIVSNLQKLRVAFDCDDQPPNLCDSKYLNDIHCISSLLKTYFRELPNPLFTYELYDKFVTAINKDDAERTVAFHHVIQRLPPPHYRTMNYLLRHLNLCASKAHETNMTAKNIAIVWAPNLLRPNVDDSVAALTEFRTQAIIVEYMIRNVDVFFDKNLASAAIAYYPEIQDMPIEVDSDCARLSTQNNGPKLITLEEARQRVNQQRTQTVATEIDGNANNRRYSNSNKLKSTYVPPKVLATPISPQPMLLSLEEAQARTRLNNKTEQLLVPQKQTASAGGASETPRDLSNVNSPRRSRKWFGLFQNSGKKSHVSEEDVTNSKIVYYTKKSSPHMSGEPTRSQSEYRLQDLQRRHEQEKDKIVRAENYQLPATSPTAEKEVSTPFKSSLNNVSAPFATPELDFDTNLSSDNEADSLMSAIVSVRAKYINVEDALIYHAPKRSFTIGSTAEFRKLDDSELTMEPPRESPAENNNNDMNTSEKNAPGDDAIQSVPCGNHRRGAPSIDSGYLSQGSTLTRTPDFELTDNSNITAGSPLERKQPRSSSGRRHTEPEEPGVPSKRIRSLSPENCKTVTTPPTTSSDGSMGNPPSKVLTRKFSRSEFYKSKSSPDSRTKSFSDMTVQENYGYGSSRNGLTTGSNSNNNNVRAEYNTSDSVASTGKTSEPMVTSPSFNKQGRRSSGGTNVRPTTLLLNKNHANELITTPTSPTAFQCDDVNEQFIESKQHQQHDIKGNAQSVTGTRPVGKPLSRRSVSSPVTKVSLSTAVDTKSVKRYSHRRSIDSSSNVEQPNDKNFLPMTTSPSPPSPVDTGLDSSQQNVIETVQWRYVNTNPLPFRSAPTTPSSPHATSPGSAKAIVDKIQARSTRDLTRTENRRRDLDNKNRRASVREKVREINRMNSNDSSSCSNNGRPNSNPVMSWSIDKAVINNNDKRSEQTKSSPNLYTSQSETTSSSSSSMVKAHEMPCRYKTATSMTISPRDSTKRQSYSDNKLTSPSYRDFDLRCRVDDTQQINAQQQFTRTETSFPLSTNDVDKITTAKISNNSSALKSRSMERFIASRNRSSPTTKHYASGRPQSEIIRTMNFNSIDTADTQNHQQQQPIRSSQSVHSVNMSHRRTENADSYNARSLRSSTSKSETNFSRHDNGDDGRQIGNFPLTLKCGSSSTNFELEKLKKTQRPMSLYDNEGRTSYYDNVNNIRYEML